MNTKLLKSKQERKLKQRRKRLLRKKRRHNKNDSPESERHTAANINTGNTQTDPQIINWRTVNRVANYWAQSRISIQEWQYKHEIAYWKSKAEALNYENKILHSVIDNIYLNRPCDSSNLLHSDHPQSSNSLNENYHLNDVEEEDAPEFEMSEEFLSFLKISEQHKLERQKAKEESSECEDNVLPPSKPVDSDRFEERERLYGKSSAVINGLETMVQLNFDCYKDLYEPNYWPTIPLNL